MPTTTAICSIVATVENSAAAIVPRSASGSPRERAPIAPIVAVLDTNPPRSPAIGSP